MANVDGAHANHKVKAAAAVATAERAALSKQLVAVHGWSAAMEKESGRLQAMQAGKSS